MADPGFATQKAIYTALLSLSTGDVYDRVPQDATYPYVVIDSTVSVRADYLNSRRDERTMYLSVWSQYKGQKEILEIMAEIDTLLNDKELTMDVGRMVRCFVESKDTQRDADNLTFQGRVKLRIITDHS